MNINRVLTLLPLFVVLAHSFSWDIVVGGINQFEFFYNGTVTHTEEIPSANFIYALTYDPVHLKMLFVDLNETLSLHSFDLTTRKMQTLLMKQISFDYYIFLAYDPLTQLLFWTEDKKINSLSLKPASSNEAVDGDLLVTSDDYCLSIAVDSCGGFIYWATRYEIERAAFNGSKREVLIHMNVFGLRSLAINQQTQEMYWIVEITDTQYSIESADLNGKNRRTFYLIGSEYYLTDLAVSKDFFYWRSQEQRAILQLPKNQNHAVAPIVYSHDHTHCSLCQLTVANYPLQEQTLGIKFCEALKSLILDVEERNGSICHNYCFQGNSHVSAEGQPKCSCNRAYSGEKCEVNACNKHCFNDGICSLNETEKPVCQCTADYQGERCDVSICKDYCLQGNCSISTEGQRTCRCNAGYSGERCEVIACHSYCLNNGDCSLNEEDEPVCQCTADYEGERCDVATTHTDVCVCADKMTQQIQQNLRSEVKQVVREELQCVTSLG